MPEPSSPSLELLVRQACAQLEGHIRAGEDARAEEYFAAHPELAADPERALDLVYAEYLARLAQGREILDDEMFQRFPQWHEPLRQQFQWHRLADSAAESRLNPSTPGCERDRPPPTGQGPPGWPARYEFLEEIGGGGMGVVFKARQIGLKRVVALKMIRAGAGAGKGALARFRVEAEAAAGLQHPHMVQIYEVGEAAGRPFLAMEYVDGGSLAEHLAGRPQPAAASAQLVETLARAMHHAHQRGIVHRDLKPANVLLQKNQTTDDTDHTDEKSANYPCDLCHPWFPKIADFGLARRLDVVSQTHTGEIVGTPSYMAPEQAAGRKGVIGPATDVYALGAILYEMLTGRPPFRADTVMETARQVREDEPVPPRRLQPRLPRDLETICLKCLAKNPRQRYASALDLADDLGRFLHGLPVHARPVGPLGKLRRWRRRQPKLAGAIGALMLVTVIGLALVSWLWQSAVKSQDAESRQRLRAEERYRQAYAATQDIISLCNAICAAALKQPLDRLEFYRLSKSLKEKALRSFEEFLRQRPDDPILRADVANACASLGYIHETLNMPGEARDWFQKALHIWRELAREQPTVDGYRNAVAAILREIDKNTALLESAAKALPIHQEAVPQGRERDPDQPSVERLRFQAAEALYYAAFYQHERGQKTAALATIAELQPVLQDLVRANYEKVVCQQRLLYCWSLRGSGYRAAGKPAQALRAFDQAQALWEQCAPVDPTHTDFPSHVAEGYYDLWKQQEQTGVPVDATAYFRRGLRYAEQRVADKPEVGPFHYYAASYSYYLGRVLDDTRRTEEAIPVFRRAAAGFQRMLDAAPDNLHVRRALAASYHKLGRLHGDRRQWSEAVTLFQRARTILEKVAQEHPDQAACQSDAGGTWHGLGDAFQHLGRYAEAHAAFRQAVRYQQAARSKDPRNARYHRYLADHYRALLRLQLRHVFRSVSPRVPEA